VRTAYLAGSVRTPDGRPASTLLVEDQQVLDLGGPELAADADHRVDLGDALVTPAFVDAHVHLTSTGLALDGLDLSQTGSLAECLDQLAAFVRVRRGGVVLGHGWDETRWPERRAPTRQELDRASYGGVVYLSRIDVHSAVVSSALLAAAPEARAARGFDESGWVTTDAHHVVRRVARQSVSLGQRRAAQLRALRRAAEMGVGLVHELGGPDISSPHDFRAALTLPEQEVVPDVVGYWGELGTADRVGALGALGAAGDLFVDGAIGSRTASLRDPYADAEHRGHAYLTAAQVRDHVLDCTRVGVQAGFHVIGDGAVETVVAGLVEAEQAVGSTELRARRHRLEHVEMLWPDAIEVLARLGVVASVQPAFDRLWGGASQMYAERLGRPRAETLNPFAALRRAGVALALGSDSPVTPIDPWGTVRAAVQHHVPAHRIELEAAFDAHTRGGWWAAGEDATGVLRPGAPATFTAWDVVGPGLPSLEPGSRLPGARRTVVRGRTVHGD
jgi:predicted amidohydrolase YtcJ